MGIYVAVIEYKEAGDADFKYSITRGFSNLKLAEQYIKSRGFGVKEDTCYKGRYPSLRIKLIEVETDV